MRKRRVEVMVKCGTGSDGDERWGVDRWALGCGLYVEIMWKSVGAVQVESESQSDHCS